MLTPESSKTSKQLKQSSKTSKRRKITKLKKNFWREISSGGGGQCSDVYCLLFAKNFVCQKIEYKISLVTTVPCLAIREDMLVRSGEGGEVRSRLLQAGGRAQALHGHHLSFTGPVGAAEVSTSTFLYCRTDRIHGGSGE